MRKIHTKKKKIDLLTSIVMGILNITDNSFYDGGQYNSEEKILSHTKKMLEEGASIIDLGAQSSKPDSEPISEKEETEKLVSTIHLLKQNFPEIIISIDTYRSKVAEKCINSGADIINDISAGEMDEEMFATIAKLKVPYIIMHMKGTPKMMQNNPKYNNVTEEVFSYLEKKVNELKQLGVTDIIIDPGFGFGKTIKHNYQLLNHLEKFTQLGVPLLIGASRKSMIYNLLETNAENALNGTTVAHTIALQKGINIIRTHDVKEAMECIKIVNFVKNNFNGNI
ncbi:MAG: dihydropteroate synthase [Flavobacteriales bacterium]|jgi:dihydropteroate synthase|nr:dihydropteroate synthase [Flavobacteriales bacterium]MBT7481189.1 dihydropteroate synthase [Flavobacteriales bacterium]